MLGSPWGPSVQCPALPQLINRKLDGALTLRAHELSSLVHSISPFGKTPLARPQMTGFLEELDFLRNSEAASVMIAVPRKPRGWAGCLRQQGRLGTRESPL